MTLNRLVEWTHTSRLFTAPASKDTHSAFPAKDMNRRAVAKVFIDSTGQLFVVPELEPGISYEYIYREANGLRWHKTLRALHAYEPGRWEPVELLRHISATLKSACDEDLQVTEGTAWEGVPPELRDKLRSALT
jgi:hypothetical protein